jgi:hypothetical protein
MSDPEILAAYPDLEVEDVREAMRYAAEAVRERELPLAAPPGHARGHGRPSPNPREDGTPVARWERSLFSLGVGL